MPTAAVLHLHALRPGSISGATGQHAAGFWLTSWREVAAEVGDALHDERALRQFTISPLFGLGPAHHGVTTVNAGDAARLRITVLDEATQAQLLGAWFLRLPAEIELAGLPWAVRRFALTPAEDPDAGSASYAELRDRYPREGRPPKRWQLRFESPTAFHLQDNRYLPFPMPRVMVASWLNRWNEYAPDPLKWPDDAIADFLRRVEAGLRISSYRLKTVSFRFRLREPDRERSRETPQFRQKKPGSERSREVAQIGCVGDLTLDGATLSPTDRADVSTLADFAFYCGAGHHTTMGMGQTRSSAA